MIEIPTFSFETIVGGAKFKGATCEHCGQQYAYIIQGSLVANGHNAATVAEDIDRSLAQAVAPVPCPSCGWLQKDMLLAISQERKWKFLSLFGARNIGAVLVAAGATAGLLGQTAVGIGLAGLGLIILVKLLFPWWANRLLNGPRAQPDSAAGDRPPAVWTREQLEEIASRHRRVDITDALLDWETQKIRHA